MNTCSICLENLSSKHIVLDCKHEYHINCIKQIKNNKCPLCRRNIVDKEYCNNSHRPVFFNSGFIKKNGKCTLCNKKTFNSLLKKFIIDNQ